MIRAMQEKERKKRNSSAAKDICYIAMFVAVMTVCSWISVFVGSIPITFQTLGVCLTAGMLGAKRGVIAIGSYIALGLCGAPVFAGFTGGFAKLAMPTGGYIIGFVLTALLCGFASDFVGENFGKRKSAFFGVMCLFGVMACYAVGMVWFMLYVNSHGTASLWAAFVSCVLPYFPFDFIKIGVAVLLVRKLKKYLR